MQVKIRFLRLAIMAVTCLWLAACAPKVPDNATPAGKLPQIYPDYVGVTAPVNIAPLNFKINERGDAFATRLTGADGQQMVIDGKVARFDIDEWHRLLGASQGGEVRVEVYVKSQGKWLAYEPFTIAVADPIDPYISYRLIEPSYVSYENMTISERCLENFDERTVLSSATLSLDDDGQCLNCHSYQDYNRQGNMQVHARGHLGGTYVNHGGCLRKVDFKTDSLRLPAVYPSWHPTLPLIAYSTNRTHQMFHTTNPNKVEVQDAESDLILYDVERDQTLVISDDTSEWETFPYWSPDGSALYYASAPAPSVSADSLDDYLTNHYREIKYNIYRRPFDAATRTFGAVDTVVNARSHGMSATLPRVSPDGRYLVSTLGEYGTFHIWHHDADLYVTDLLTGETQPLMAVNSDDTESYHSFSSNGRWLLLSSRRDDGSYTRLYIAYFGPDGRAAKPLLLPQENPDHNILRFKSYNVPEFMVAPAPSLTLD